MSNKMAERESVDETAGRSPLWRRVVDLYVDGFRNMTVGRTLWALIIFKVVVLLVVFKLLFFPDVLSRDYSTDEERADAVRRTLVERSAGGMSDDSIIINKTNR